jgi:amphi-Trp domain-containing protein
MGPEGGLSVAKKKTRPKRDIEKDYPARQFASKLRRLADCIEEGQRFRIQVANVRVTVPSGATINIEHERGDEEEEIEFQMRWPVEQGDGR